MQDSEWENSDMVFTFLDVAAPATKNKTERDYFTLCLELCRHFIVSLHSSRILLISKILC